MTSEDKNPPPIFLDISPDAKPIEMESLCMNCMKNGNTTILLTRIPFFREVMISRFECPHCGLNNNSIQFAGEYPAKGVHFELHVKSPEDLNRRIVKSCHCVIKVPAIELEIPGPTQGDSISTIEGVLEQAYEGLKTAEQTPQLVEFLENLQQCAKGLVQFDFIIDDPSGNSFIENPVAPTKDPSLDVSFYNRTPEQNESIGLMAKPQADQFQVDDDSSEHIDSVFSQDNQVMTFPTTCPVCSTEGTMRSCTLVIPHFKEIVIMAFNCQQCSYHNGEVMVGGAVSPKARKITLACDCQNDLNREVLKSETASIAIPDCELELIPGTLGGKFTTIEGLLKDIHKNLKDNNPFVKGDSAVNDSSKFDGILNSLEQYRKNEKPFTIIIEDPLSNSYIQEYGENDKIQIVDTERTFEQNEALGINDMKTEEYITEHGAVYSQPKGLARKEEDKTETEAENKDEKPAESKE
ncbi:ZPR1-related zinc finger protein [Tritrichomonas foetus]|uniref:ZPR1-related zinc finger protein n=1 Tax=Tritrichomonas foetus TaxID=1144522 RepID=A0A1J4KIJ8_9EUKA|nr:ZPR1-related zinc finger protein [Tritrichomonas foetus]|eukprot:OHT09133.1 ZPR1-related zinc finger protein [Tritrichomonas foetus]